VQELGEQYNIRLERRRRKKNKQGDNINLTFFFVLKIYLLTRTRLSERITKPGRLITPLSMVTSIKNGVKGCKIEKLVMTLRILSTTTSRFRALNFTTKDIFAKQ